ncbi:MAG TPA: acyl-CoA dehydrogenase family protein [Candidatus Limnocylindrales bacterium]|jgi:butyryl-CoA dehydrogenase|nr:acyl-CoA dehydrogenase family protein [Candidatus Limnocylindrales bacterium]
MALDTAPARDPFALSEEERGVRDLVRDWAQREIAPGAAARDEHERYDRSLFDHAGELGLTGLPYPENYGGAGMGTFAWSLAIEEIAAADMAMAVSLSVHVLSQLCIFANGSDEQKERFLPPMTAGRELGAFALTEPQAGSDAASLSLSAVPDGDEYLLTGTKIWITNAGEAARYIVFGTVDRSKGKAGITAFVVEADTPGFRLGSKERKMGIRGTTGYELVFEEARVPAANRLGEEGDGLRVALSALGAGRISIAAACTGLARNALELAARYALQRRQFGRAIADQEMIQAMLAEMAVQVEAARLLTWRAARMRDAGQPINSASSMAKWYASDAAMRVTTDAVQIYGGAGYSRDNPVERLMRDAKGAQIYEGTNQIHRLIVAQGLLDAMRREG